MLSFGTVTNPFKHFSQSQGGMNMIICVPTPQIFKCFVNSSQVEKTDVFGHGKHILWWELVTDIAVSFVL